MPASPVFLLLLVLFSLSTGRIVCRTEAGLSQLLYRACYADPFCADQYPGLQLASQNTAASDAAQDVGVVQNRPLQGLHADSQTLGFLASPPAAMARDDDEELQHVHMAVWGKNGIPAGGLLVAEAASAEAQDCVQLARATTALSHEADLTLRLASAALVRYRQAIVAGPLCTDPMRVRVYSPSQGGFVCVCRENHDCEQPKYEVALLTYLFQFDVILVMAAAVLLSLATRDLIHSKKTQRGGTRPPPVLRGEGK